MLDKTKNIIRFICYNETYTQISIMICLYILFLPFVLYGIDRLSGAILFIVIIVLLIGTIKCLLLKRNKNHSLSMIKDKGGDNKNGKIK